MSNDYTPPPITTPLGQVVNTKRAQQQRNFAMQPTQLNKSQQWLRDNPIPPAMGIVDELKSMLDPGNMTGANAIMAAINGNGMSPTKRITTGLTGIVQGLGFAAGGAGGKSTVEGIANTGIPARVVNKVKGETPLLHASPNAGATVINPTLGSAAMPDAKVAFGWNAQDFLPNNPSGLIENSMPYTGTLSSGGGRLKGTLRAPAKTGSIYVTKGKIKDNMVTDPNQNFMMATTSPQPVLKEFNMGKYVEESQQPGFSTNFNQKQLQADVLSALQRAGAKVKPNIVEKMLTKAEAAKIARRNRNDPSPV